VTYRGDLERRYRRLLAWYPRGFRLEYEQEMLAVLMAGSGGGQRRPRLAEVADLIRGAAWTRLCPTARPPRTVVAAVRLMYVGALGQLLTLVTVLATLGTLRAAVFHTYPDLTASEWQSAVLAHIAPVVLGSPIVMGLWLLMAWGNRGGRPWSRVLVAAFFGVTTISLVADVAQRAVAFASADLVAGGVLWLVALSAVVLIFSTDAKPHYVRRRGMAAGAG
jgi:hypothetical protein